MKSVFTFLFSFIFYIIIQAQQPLNSDFENWTSGEPDDWFTNNIPSVLTVVSQSGNAFHGSLCAKLQVEDIGGGTAYPPYLSNYDPATQLGHPVSEKHGSLHGYYKSNPVGNDHLMVLILMMQGQSNTVGAGGGILGSAASWTEFNIPIYYSPSTPNPDNAIIEFTVIDTSTQGSNIGSEAYVDYIDLTAPSSVEQLSGLPNEFTLKQNYPNPFNPSTKIEYSIPEASLVQLKIYDVLGNEVATLVNEEQSAGTYRADFTGQNLASGLYIAELIAGNLKKTIKMSLMK